MAVNSTLTHSGKKQQALALLQQNRLAEAKSLYSELCRIDKTDAESNYMLGVVNGKLGQLAEAVDCFRRAIAIQPQMVMAHCGLGAALKAQEKFNEAISGFREAVRLKPDFAEAHFDLGSVLFMSGSINDAESHFQQALRLKPSVNMYLGIGDLYFIQGMMKEAAASYQAALKLKPDYAEACNKLGNACFRLGRLDEAIDNFRNAIKLKPDFLEAYNDLGGALTSVGRIDEARDYYQKALRIKPDSVNTVAGLAWTYEWMADYEQAYTLLAPFIEQQTDHVGTAFAFARFCKHIKRCPEAIDLLQKIIQQNNISPSEKRQMHFSLGRLYDSSKAYDEAFDHYKIANSIQAPPYDAMEYERSIDALISTFTTDMLQRLPRASHVSDRPVFIVGMPRSGTSLVEQILASHPKVHGAGELIDIGRFVSQMSELLDPRLGYPACIRKFTGDAANKLAREYLEHLHDLSADAVRVTDKMPHNFRQLGLISLLFPKARIIHCIRDPLDTCLSIYFQSFNSSHEYACDLNQIGSHYRQYERLMAHWRQVVDIPMLEVRYEDIVTNPDEMIPKLVEFCGLDWDPDCLRFYENKRFVGTASYDQVRQPLHPKSIGRWKHYERHLEQLKSALGTP